MIYFLVGIAGIVGALLRYFLGIYFNQWWYHDFPLATFITNMAGSMALGWLTAFLTRYKFIHPYLLTALGTGLIGAFTTFSTFSVETVQLIMDAKWGTAFVYILFSVVGGLLFSWLGYRLGKAEERWNKG